MRTILKISGILSWFNLVVWGIFASMGLLSALTMGNLSFLVVTFLTGVTVLHSYASLKLHKSIRYSNVPLSDQTPVGIRFIGFIALFFGVLYIGNSVGLLQNTPEIIKMLKPQLPPEYKNVDLPGFLRGVAVFFLITGICIAVNVFLNFRLLRWYYLVKQSDIS